MLLNLFISWLHHKIIMLYITVLFVGSLIDFQSVKNFVRVFTLKPTYSWILNFEMTSLLNLAVNYDLKTTSLNCINLWNKLNNWSFHAGVKIIRFASNQSWQPALSDHTLWFSSDSISIISPLVSLPKAYYSQKNISIEVHLMISNIRITVELIRVIVCFLIDVWRSPMGFFFIISNKTWKARVD